VPLTFNRTSYTATVPRLAKGGSYTFTHAPKAGTTTVVVPAAKPMAIRAPHDGDTVTRVKDFTIRYVPSDPAADTSIQADIITSISSDHLTTNTTPVREPDNGKLHL
jgi:hypothetical protein